MPFDITNKAHVSTFISQTNKVAVALFNLRQALIDYDALDTTNGVRQELLVAGAVFPEGITLIPTDVNLARSSLVIVSDAIGLAMTPIVIDRINKVRQAIGVVAGTG